MAGLEAILRIGAQNDATKAVDDLLKHLKALSGQIASVDKVVAAVNKVSGPTDAMAKSLTEAQRAMASQSMEAIAAAEALDRLVAPTDLAARAQLQMAERINAATSALERQSGAAASAGRRIAATAHEAAGLRKAMGELMPFAGPMILEGTKKAIEAGADYDQTAFRLRAVSRGDANEAPQAEALARSLAAQYPALSAGKVLDTYMELRANGLGDDGRIDMAKAKRNLSVAAQAQAAGAAYGIDVTPSDMQNLIKAVEGSGRAGDPDALRKITNAYLSGKLMYGSALNSEQLRDYVANAKSANFSLGDDTFYRQAITRVTEGNASRLGNEVNQTMATLVGGSMKKATALWLVQAGLVRPDQIVSTGGGNVKIRGGIKGADLLQTNQMQWANTYLHGALERTGVLSEPKVRSRMDMLRAQELAAHPDAKIDDKFLRERAEAGLLSAAITQSGARNTVTDNLIHLLANFSLIMRDMKGMDNIDALAGAQQAGQNPVAAFNELTTALKDLGAAATAPGVQLISPALDAIAHAIAKAAEEARKFASVHPLEAGGLSLAAIGGALGVGGAYALKLMTGVGKLFGFGGSAASAATLAPGAATGPGLLAYLLAGGLPAAIGVGDAQLAKASGALGDYLFGKPGHERTAFENLGLSTPGSRGPESDPQWFKDLRAWLHGGTSVHSRPGTADMNALAAHFALYRAGYSGAELAAEGGRETARARALSGMGDDHFSSLARSLAELAHHGREDLRVSGSAEADLRIRVEAGSELLRVLDQARGIVMNIPLRGDPGISTPEASIPRGALGRR